MKREERTSGTNRYASGTIAYDYFLTTALGNWLGLIPIPHGWTLELLETKLEDKTAFLRFVRRMLTWIPEERQTTKELLEDPWLT